MSEPLRIQVARVREAWGDMLQELGILLVESGFKLRERSNEEISNWEREREELR